MGKSYYDAAKVDEMLDKSASVIEAFASTIEEQHNEIANLRRELDLAKSAAAGQVTLEKVAGLKQASALEFANFLADRAFIGTGDVEKYAKAMVDDPEAVRLFATKAIESSMAPASQGYGVKQASATQNDALERENRLWAEAGYRA